MYERYDPLLIIKAYYMRRKRCKRKYRTSSRWEKIIVLSVVASYVIAISADALIAYAEGLRSEPAPVVEAAIAEEVKPVEVRIKVNIDWTKERIKQEVWERAEKYNTFPDKMWNTILCENQQLNPKQQSNIVKDGVREDSWGLAQFHLPSRNKTADGVVITKEMAQDPEIALDAMAYHFSIGNARLWTCYRMLYQ